MNYGVGEEEIIHRGLPAQARHRVGLIFWGSELGPWAEPCRLLL